MKKQRYLIPNLGENSEPIEKAIDFAMVNEFEEIFLVIHDELFKRNLQAIGLIENNTVDEINLNGAECKIVSLNKFLKHSVNNNSIAISLWLSSEELFKIDEMTGLHAIIGIPFYDNSLGFWTDTFGPINLITNESFPVKTISNSQLKEAFDNLNSNQINWTTLNTQDIRDIKNMIKKHKDSVDPIEVFSYLKREKGLNYGSSDDLMKWTKDLIIGKKVRI